MAPTRQVGARDAALRLEAFRQVRVGVQGDAVRPQLGHLGDGALERLGRLHRQAVDEVGIDGLETQGFGLTHQRLHTFEGLHAAHGGLHRRVEVLDAPRPSSAVCRSISAASDCS